ncbi:MAG: amino acid ABC transporter permease [Nocardioidaceae bacterium]|nr:amino acid ABC transporter permease [Nocardioidaceae bacterium]
MSQVLLYDIPGPRARARHRIYAVLGGLFVLAVLAAAGWKLWDAGAITGETWTFLNEPLIVEDLLGGLVRTFEAAALAIGLAIVFGAVFAAGRLSGHSVIRWPSTLVVQFFRATPVLLLILFLFFAYGSTLGAFGALVVALTLYNGSVLAEIFRAGLLAVPHGQSEAAYAVGLRKLQVTTLILAPQAVRTMLPAIISQCVVALKDTALGYVIGSGEIVYEAKQIFRSPLYNNPIPVAITLAVIFIIINYSLSKLAQYLERRLSRRGEKAVDAAAYESGMGGAVA